jgi:filamentous hemagglutinin
VGLGGAAIGATGGAADVTQGSMAAVNAVENNSLTPEDRAKLDNAKADCQRTGNNTSCKVFEDLESLDKLTDMLDEPGLGVGIPDVAVDFMPIIGDIKGYAEAESFVDYIFATVGVVPFVGDAIKSARTAYMAAKAAGDVKGMKNALEEVAQVCSGGSCFEAGTLVQTQNGLQAIETFVGGELVWSRDEVTGAMAYKPVIATKVTANQAIYRITVQNQQGQIETFGTTSEHPFWVKDWGWIKASLLQAGTELVDAQNQTLRITNAELTDETATVYNIEIADYHTYHVGHLGVWVHNANCCDVAQKFESKIAKLPPNEKIAVIKTEAQIAANNLGLVKDNRLSKINNRDVYKGNDGNYYALDTQHGRWEVTNSKGKHQGEVTLHTLSPKGKQDLSRGHDLIVK